MKNYLKNLDWQKLLIGTALLTAVFSLFVLIWPIAFAVHDDLRTYLEVKSGTMLSSTDSLAKEQGRFYFWFSAIFSYFPYLFDSLAAAKLISYIALIFDGVAFYFFLKRLSGKWVGLAGFLLFFSLGQLQESFQHNLFVAYIFCHQIAVGILLFGLERFLAYEENGRGKACKDNWKMLLISALLLLFATMLYEAFLLFSGLFFLISLMYHKKDKKWDIKGTFYDLRWHICFMSLFLVAYLVWGRMFPSTYSGATFGGVGLLSMLEGILTYATGYFPLRTACFVWRNAGIRNSFSPSALFVSLWIACGFVLILRQGRIIKNKGKLVFIGLAGAVLPVCLHSVTAKYIAWLKEGIYSYVPSFYSYFFLLCVLLGVGWFLYEKIPFKKLFLGVAFVGMMGASYITQVGNALLVEPYVDNLEKYEAFDRVVSSEEFGEIPDGAWIYAPDYIGIHENLDSLSTYAGIYTDKAYRFTNEFDHISWESDVYYLDYDQEAEGIYLAEIRADGQAGHGKFLSFESKDGENNAMEDVLETPTLSFGEGFYGVEGLKETGTRWCGKEGVLRVANYSKEEKSGYLTFDLSTTLEVENPKVTIVYGREVEEIILTEQWQRVRIPLEMLPGQSPVKFQCNYEPLKAADGRSLAFLIQNARIELQHTLHD